HDEQALAGDQLFEDVGAMPEVAGGRPNIRADGVIDERGRIMSQLRGKQRLDRGPHAVDDRAQVARLFLARATELVERGDDSAAAGVPKHYDEASVEALGCEFHAADLRRRHDVAGHADHEQVAQALIEHELRGHTGVGAAEDDRERLLPLRELGAARLTYGRVAAALGHEALVAVPEERKRLP